MESKILHIKNRMVGGELDLTSSKSISNRVQIIRALSPKPFEIDNLSTAKDTATMETILSECANNGIYDVGPAGTTMRFLTAYFSVLAGERTLTGSERMKERPIHVLVNALRELGASIDYIEKDGFPPLKISGKTLNGGTIQIDGSISSQFITALLLIAPSLKEGVRIVFNGDIVSVPYINMTLRLMEYYGINTKWSGNTITIPAQSYLSKRITIEADWSSASYWYSLAALAPRASITLNGLKENSLQGDSIVASLYDELGIKTKYTSQGITLIKRENYAISPSFEYDFTECPDIAQTLAVTCAGLKLKTKLTGLKTLKIKETDRIAAIANELHKFNIECFCTNDSITFNGKTFKENPGVIINTYEDHRMAMAFAPLGLINDSLGFDDKGVVDKSYPEFWGHLDAFTSH